MMKKFILLSMLFLNCIYGLQQTCRTKKELLLETYAKNSNIEKTFVYSRRNDKYLIDVRPVSKQDNRRNYFDKTKQNFSQIQLEHHIMIDEIDHTIVNKPEHQIIVDEFDSDLCKK